VNPPSIFGNPRLGTAPTKSICFLPEDCFLCPPLNACLFIPLFRLSGEVSSLVFLGREPHLGGKPICLGKPRRPTARFPEVPLPCPVAVPHLSILSTLNHWIYLFCRNGFQKRRTTHGTDGPSLYNASMYTKHPVGTILFLRPFEHPFSRLPSSCFSPIRERYPRRCHRQLAGKASERFLVKDTPFFFSKTPNLKRRFLTQREVLP